MRYTLDKTKAMKRWKVKAWLKITRHKINTRKLK
jgi:hypothetical protein